MRDLDIGRDEVIDTGDLLKTGVTCAADGAVLFAGALESETAANQIYLGRATGRATALTQGDGFKVPSKIDAAGRTLLFLVPRQRPFRAAAAGGGRGGGAGAPPRRPIRPRPRAPAAGRRCRRRRRRRRRPTPRRRSAS